MMKCCFRCGHVFNHKSNLNRHLIRKIPCEPKYLDVPGQDILDNFVYYSQQFDKLTGNNKDNGEINDIEVNEIKLEKTNKIELVPESEDEFNELDDIVIDDLYKCEGCCKTFNKKNNYYRHRKLYCPVLKDEYKALRSYKKKLDNKYRVMKQEHIASKQKHDMYDDTNIKSIYEMSQPDIIEQNDIFINDTSNHSQNTQNNKLENSMNSYNAQNLQLKQNTHDVFNKNEFNITINEYGNEDVSGVSQSEWKQIVKRLYYALPDLVKKVHFDIETNRNVYVPNIREKYALVWKNNKWEMMDIREVLDDLLVNNTDRIYEFLEENESFIGDSLHSKMNNIIEKINNNEKLQKKYQNQIKVMLINNRGVVKRSYEDTSGKKLEIK
jgi:hypothetical protein